MITLIKIGGLFNLALAIFHLLFWQLFNWREDLRSLSYLNRGIMQALNLTLTFVFIAFAYLSLVHTYELYLTTLGRSLLLSISVLFMLRALMQVVYFRLTHWGSTVFLVLFIGGGLLYGIPAVSAP
jgi:hypothetical protein